MRIGIFNRWLHTQGGAERQTGAAAQALAADGHEVTFITTTPTDLGTLSRRLNLNLADVALRVVNDLPYSDLAALTAEYDLFINGSHMDAIPSRAPASILFIYFPHPRNRAQIARLARATAEWCATHVVGVRFGNGFYGIERVGDGWYRAMGRRATFSVPGTKREVTITLAVGNFAAREPLHACFSAQGTMLADLAVPPSAGNFQTVTLHVPAHAAQSDRVCIEIESDTVEPNPDTPQERRALGIAVSQITADTLPSRLYTRLVERRLPRLGTQVQSLLAESMMGYLETYDLILANSAYTASWLRRLWGADSDVLYPPVGIESFAPARKSKTILSTGRFFVGGHSKRQDVLVQAFRTLVASGADDWHLHLVGQVGRTAADRAYVAQIREMAAGLPVTLHPNADFATLQELSAQASLYWHAAGYEVDEEKDPYRVEHFGISVVEAMSAGAVPLAVGKGGVTEIIEPGKSGILWQSIDDLVTATQRLIADPGSRERLSAAAIRRSKEFAQERYGSAMQDIVRRVASTQA